MFNYWWRDCKSKTHTQPTLYVQLNALTTIYFGKSHVILSRVNHDRIRSRIHQLHIAYARWGITPINNSTASPISGGAWDFINTLKLWGTMKLLTVGGNTKINKSDSGHTYLTAILHLAPANLSGHQVCPWATEGCKQACLNTAGRGRFSNVQDARIRKTRLFFDNREEFMSLLIADINALCRKCERESLLPVVRLNGTSDLLWERIPAAGKRNIFELFPNVQFYDYTKAPPSKRREYDNYSLVYSRADDSQKPELVQALSKGGKVAVVFSGELPKYYWGYPVIDGDKDDLRFLDPEGCIIGLSAKGLAKKDTSGFVVNV